MSKQIETSLLKIILLNDMLHTELISVNPNMIQDRNIAERKLKLRLRNSLKSVRMLSEIADDFFESENVTDLFGNVADVMKDLFDAYVDNRLKIQGKSFEKFPDDFTSTMFNDLFDHILSGDVSLNPNLHAYKFKINGIIKASNKNMIEYINAIDKEDAIILFNYRHPECTISKIEKESF